ncbi:MAG: twin-arginine translocase subunit TatC [Gammaproteobacteria bacterium]
MADDTHAEPPEELPEASLMSHLLELRSRLLKAGGAVLAVFVCLLPFSRTIFSAVSSPLMAKLPTGSTMIATEVASPFLTPFKTSFYVAIMVAIPAVLYQVWAFVAPGLYRKEKRLAVPLLISSVLLFYLGVVFAYFVIFPVMFGFFAAAAPDNVQMMTDINAYLDFVLVLFIAFGLAFEVPVVTVLLVLVGMVKIDTLTKNRQYFFLGAFVLGMVLTPPDVLSQTLLAIPMYLLYEGGILMARLLSRPAKAGESIGDKAA